MNSIQNILTLMARKKVILAIISAIITSLAFPFPPFKLGFLVYFSLLILLLALEGVRPREAFGIGYIWGAVFNLLMLYGVFWATLPGTFGAILAIAVLPAINCWLYRYISTKSKILGYVFWPLVWVSWDYLRSLTELNFPWTDFGYTQSYYLPLIQAAEIFAVYGVSLMIHTVNILLFGAYKTSHNNRRYLLSATAIALPLIFALYGYIRLPQELEPGTYKIALAQGNVGPDIKWENGGDKYSLDTYMDLTRQAASGGARMVIWPETAMPFYFLHEQDKLIPLQGCIDSLKINLLTGTPEYETVGRREYVYFNSAALLTPGNHQVQLYSKIKLVPMSERIPFSGRFKKLRDIHLGQADFSSGRDMTLFSVDGYKFATLICFESAFPGYCTDFCRKGAQFLVVITNDMWFGPSPVPYHHAQMSVFRAIENRVPIARCANTGVSMFIDRWGRVYSQTTTFEKKLVINAIQPENSTSIYSLYGNWLAILCVIGTILIIAIAFYRHKGYNI